ncbi:MAG: hypothetical protein KKA84_05005 [Bacteroidetes bacterium]|nr:hypothetical protein [Bacteroidota bacterium]
MSFKNEHAEIIDWLLDGDPSVVYQTNRDLLGKSEKSLAADRKKIAGSGWGKKLLDFQDDDGKWSGGFYTPKWTSTTYTLCLLRRLGLEPKHPKAIKACKLLAENGINEGGGIGYGWPTYPRGETCVTGMTLAFFAYFQLKEKRLAEIVKYLLKEQMPDGGWNCRRHRDNTSHSSFHTTINVLEGLLQYRTSIKDDNDIQAAQEKAHEFLLQHRLYKSHRTGEIVHNTMTRFSFPPRWKYDIMRVLDYFQMANVPYDERMNDALTIVTNKMKDGKWPLQQKHSGTVFFDLEQTGKPSRINTLRALRILKKYEINMPLKILA